ncbi:hypothetical protein HRbin20_01236 [bacterium HR20]|nr:hypothetical protein HRbin20_01236 [bacterium HR20]
MPALDHLGKVSDHVIAQVVEAELVVGAVGDVAGILVFALGGLHLRLDAPHRHTEHVIDRLHPLAVAAGKVIVDGDKVRTVSSQRVQVERCNGNERFSFAGGHFGDLALVEDDAAHELDVVGDHIPDDFVASDGVRVAAFSKSAADFFEESEGFGEDLIEQLADGGVLGILGTGDLLIDFDALILGESRVQ